MARTITTHPDKLYTIVYTSPDGEAVEIVGTGNHPIYVLRTNSFIPMEDVKPDDKLLLSSGRACKVLSVTQSSVASLDHTFTTYNLEVADFHTYFICEHGV